MMGMMIMWCEYCVYVHKLTTCAIAQSIQNDGKHELEDQTKTFLAHTYLPMSLPTVQYIPRTWHSVLLHHEPKLRKTLLAYNGSRPMYQISTRLHPRPSVKHTSTPLLAYFQKYARLPSHALNQTRQVCVYVTSFTPDGDARATSKS